MHGFTEIDQISNSVLFGVCLASVGVRYYVRYFIQKQLSIDDGILLFGILCLISAMVLLFIFVDDLFLVEALEGNTIPASLPVDFLEHVTQFEKLVVGALVLTWCSIISVKFSYLFLFRKLIDRIRPMVLYWWVAVVFNALISIYGIIIYAGVRPWYCTTISGTSWILTLTHPFDLRITTDGFGLSGVLAGRWSRQIIRFRNEPDDPRHRRRFYE